MDDDTQDHDLSPSPATEPEHAAEPETPAIAEVVADHGATLASHTSAIANLGRKLDDLADELDAAGGAGGIVQEIVDFLHRLFPGHNAPGTPTDKQAV